MEPSWDTLTESPRWQVGGKTLFHLELGPKCIEGRRHFGPPIPFAALLQQSAFDICTAWTAFQVLRDHHQSQGADSRCYPNPELVLQLGSIGRHRYLIMFSNPTYN